MKGIEIDCERAMDGAGRPEVIQSHSIFEQGPAEMMKKKGYKAAGALGGRNQWISVQTAQEKDQDGGIPLLVSQFSLPCCWLLPDSW